MRLLTAISLALVALMALACTATPATPAPTPLPTPNFSKSEILELVKDRSNRSCLSTDAHVITGAERVTIAKRRGVMGNPSKAPYDYETVRYPYSVVSGSFWNKIDITYKPSGVWPVVAKAGWEEKNENGTEKTISDSCTFRIDDGTGSLIK